MSTVRAEAEANTRDPDASADGAGRAEGADFIRAMIAEDLRTGKHGGRLVTRFPPEPNGFLHIGHAKPICLNFGIAREFGGRCHLRFDDTNPETEDQRYVESIMDSVRWLGFDWGPHLYFASDYFEAMYEFALNLVRAGEAYVDSSTEEEIRDARGTIYEPGRPTPYRVRSVEENLDLFRRMRAGEFPNGAHVLRAKIDLASPNLLLRDPVLYRIRHAHHYRTGDEWPIYPLYDFAHTIEDALECVTHSLPSLEFETHRPLYDWVAEQWLAHAPDVVPETLRRSGVDPLPPCRPEQTEFARLALDYTILSKRKLRQLVSDGLVSGWDDPRMPTLAGVRRRGVTPEAIRAFCDLIGVAKTNSRIDLGKLEYAIRDDLNTRAPRVMGVLDPLRVVITNFPEGETEELDASYWPHDVPKEGSRPVPFGREILIERDDFMENPPRGFHRLTPGGEVRLRYAYWIRCNEVVKDDDGKIIELRCSYDPETRGGKNPPDGRRVKGTIHWVSAEHGLPAEVRLYDRLFTVPDPEGGEDFREFLNPESLRVLRDARIEPSVAGDAANTRYQFERQGYFWRDPVDSAPERPVFNRIVTLKDTWAKASAESQRAERERSKAKAQQPARAPEPVPQPTPREEWRPEDPEVAAAFERFVEQLGPGEEEARILVQDPPLARFFDEALAAYDNPQSIANWTINELPRVRDDRSPSSFRSTPGSSPHWSSWSTPTPSPRVRGGRCWRSWRKPGVIPGGSSRARVSSSSATGQRSRKPWTGWSQATPAKWLSTAMVKRGCSAFSLGR